MAQRQWRSDDTDDWNEAFGDGSVGSTYAVPSNEGCSGTISTTSVTLASAGSFSNGDLVLIHQSRGTGVGTWELNKISSGGGTTSLTMAYDLTNTYTDSGASQAQIIEMSQYDGMTTGSITAPAWDGSKGGIIAFFDKGDTTIDGTLTLSGRGFQGGLGRDGSGLVCYNGEGNPAASSITRSANGNSGGGGITEYGSAQWAGGGGGANALDGGDALGHNGASTTPGGTAFGDAELVAIALSGTGGGAGKSGSPKDGADGSAMFFIFGKTITITGGINSDGIDGLSVGGNPTGSGASAGGSGLFKCVDLILGSNLAHALGATGGASSYGTPGGDGSVGRFHVDYSGTVTGTTNPTIDTREDLTITAGALVGAFLLGLL